MEDENDKLLLHSIGVTSVNPDDLERTILSQANCNTECDTRNAEEDDERGSKNVEGFSKIYSQLRAVNLEIDTIASTFEEDGIERNIDDDEPNSDDQDNEDCRIGKQVTSNDCELRQVLAADRLKSLRATKNQLEQTLSEFQCGNFDLSQQCEVSLKSIVHEEPNLKRKSKEVERSGKRKKAGFTGEETELDSLLDTASAGLVETEREKLIRKGVLTPFHQLKGFERRLHNPDSSNEKNAEDGVHDSVERAARKFAETAKARRRTKLVDSEALPKLDGSSCSFQRLKASLKTSTADVKTTAIEDKAKKRPLPSQRFRNRVSSEDAEYLLENNENEGSEEQISDRTDEDEEPNYVTIEGGLRIPSELFEKLFDYQKVGVQWLWELHCQRAGGIIGDEMGLGKTIQVLSFLGALHFSNMYKPSIVVCPATLLRQWKREAKSWYPKFQVTLLHDSAQISSSHKKRTSNQASDSDLEESYESENEGRKPPKSAKKWGSLIDRVAKSKSGLIVTTYEHLRLLSDKLLDIEWGYAVLDEGHRIRNPNADITLVCKQLQTVHRIIMTGAPIQNRLTELWSLFDFVFPGKLGVLPVFEAEFSVPISVGGYANASSLQVSTAYRCAVVLRDLIMPYLLRRMKSDVNVDLPNKSEHVLFCSLTPEQRLIYRAFLASKDVEQIFEGNRNSLYGIDILRKICNHPDLLDKEQSPEFGAFEKSGKMKVIAQLLKVWKGQNHRVLLFSQTQQMLDILESFLVANEYCYRRMDGSTAVKQRMALIDEFNNSNEVFVFILTTKVGGLGTNLTGADRVIIYDPDWNPSNDMQARERAWRIGQKKDVAVYRLITRGTIEEKVYQRQIYKHFLTNKILKNPRQRRFFRARDMKDLFTLNDDGSNGSTETSNMFSHLADEVSNPTEGSENSEGAGGERNILKTLFDADGIHSAVNHDAIMNAHEEEKIRVEEQAGDVARKAAEALRQSRMLRSHDSISVPTWTGRAGAAGAPVSVRRKFGSTVSSHLAKSEDSRLSSLVGRSSGKAVSSSELLARIDSNKKKAASAGVGTSRSVQPEILIRMICTFMQERGGAADSSTIVDHFRERVPSQNLPLFKSLLKEIASLENRGVSKMWVLKPDFI